MKKLIAFLPFLFLASCASATAEVEICKTDEVDYTDLGFRKDKVHQAIYTKEIDISAQIKKIEKFGTVSISVTKSNIQSLDGDFGWAGSIKIEAVNGNTVTTLSETIISSTQETVEININDAVDLTNLVDDGKVQLRYTITGTAPPSFKINNNVCFGLKAETSKNL